MSTPQPNRMKIVVSPLSVPQSVLKGPSDDEYRSETSLPRTSLSRLPEKRVLQPSLVENTDENLSPSTSKKPCLRVSLAVSESNADLKAEIGKLQEKIAWMASTRGSEVNSGLRLADLQEELRQERENSAKLKIKAERLERRVEDSERLQEALGSAREEAQSARKQVTALEMKIASYDDHERTIAALTEMNQELDQRATEAASEAEAVREMYERKLEALGEEIKGLRSSWEESKKSLEEAREEAGQLTARLEGERRARCEEVEEMRMRMMKAGEESEEKVKGLTVELEEVRAQWGAVEARLLEQEKEYECRVKELEEGMRADREAVAEEESRMLTEMKAELEDRKVRLERSEEEVAALQRELMMMKGEDEGGGGGVAEEGGRKRRRTTDHGEAVRASVDQSIATEGPAWALMVNVSSNTAFIEEDATVGDREVDEEKWRDEVDRLTDALKESRGRLAAAWEEGERLAGLLEEGKERAEVFMRQRDGERKGMRMMIDDLEEELERYKTCLAEREATEVEAITEAILKDATESAITMAVAREMGKSSEGLRMGLEEMRGKLCVEWGARGCLEETNRRLEMMLREAQGEGMEIRHQCAELKAAVERSERERESVSMMKEEETEAMNRLDEAVRKLEGEREEVRGRWEEMEGSLRRELENLGEEMMQWKERAGEAEERLLEEARKAEVKDEERQVYEEKLKELSQQLSCSGDTTERLMRELEGARLEGNEVRQCLVNQREGYEKTIAQLEENLRDVEGKLAAAEVSVEESRVELAAREEELSREVKERGEAVEGLERQLEEARGKVDELQRALVEEEEKYSVLAQTNERHIAALERQIEQARVGYEKHIDEMNNHLLEIQSDHEVEIARIGKEAIIEHDELIEAYNARMAQLQEEIDEKDAKIEALSKEATVLVETLKDAARDEAAQISEEYEGKMEDLEKELGRVRAELEEAKREGEGRLERAMAEFEEMLRQKEAEYRQELQRMEEAEKARLEEKEKEGELVRGELQKTIARLFEEKEELVEMHAKTEAMLEKQMAEETSKATSDRAQLVVSNTALLADMKAEYEVKVELMEERLREAVGRAESFERELEQCKAENERALASLQTAADVKVKELKAALEEHKVQKEALRGELLRVKSSIGDAVRGAEKGWEVAIRNLVDLPERYKATYDDFLQAKVRVEELTKELAEGHKQQNRLEERIKRLQSGKLSASDEKTEATARQLRYEIRQLKDEYADLATRNIDFKRMAAEARCEAIQSAKLIVTYKREKDAAVLEKEEALAGMGKAERKKRSSLLAEDSQAKSSSRPLTQPVVPAPPPSVKSALKKPPPEAEVSENVRSTPPSTGQLQVRVKAKPTTSPPAAVAVESKNVSQKDSSGNFKKMTPKKAQPKRSAAPIEDPPPNKKRISMSPEDCKQQ